MRLLYLRSIPLLHLPADNPFQKSIRQIVAHNNCRHNLKPRRMLPLPKGHEGRNYFARMIADPESPFDFRHDRVIEIETAGHCAVCQRCVEQDVLLPLPMTVASPGPRSSGQQGVKGRGGFARVTPYGATQSIEHEAFRLMHDALGNIACPEAENLFRELSGKTHFFHNFLDVFLCYEMRATGIAIMKVP